MKRRTFLKTATGITAMAAPAIRRAAAQPAPTRNETLILVPEYGPNSMDMQGIGLEKPEQFVALDDRTFVSTSSAATSATPIRLAAGNPARFR